MKRPEPLLPRIRNRLWTEQKATLIERYLYYFVLVTKHGTYIDGFSGPQYNDQQQSWAAKLVLNSQPPWLRHIHLFEESESSLKALRALYAEQMARRRIDRSRKGRTIEIHPGDFNVRVHELLKTRAIKPKEAVFCLLDQRTFECKWSSIEALARHRKTGHKIELFYFLAIHWLPRSIAATTQDRDKLRRWWGRDDWDVLRSMAVQEKGTYVAQRFREELGYSSAKAWPIYENRTSSRIMYFMIHATDHPEAPKLMARAYDRCVRPKEMLESAQQALFPGIPMRAGLDQVGSVPPAHDEG